MKNKTYKVLGLLLTYPDEKVLSALDECKAVINEEKLLSAEQIIELEVFFDYLKTTNLLTLQADYVNLFDLKRTFSLHLFEHTLGDSRDRGPAMVDLIKCYNEFGLDLQLDELPDYLPVFLEFVSSLPEEKASAQLAKAVNIIGVLGARLKAFGNTYSTIFTALLSLSPTKPDEEIIQKAMAQSSKQESVDNQWREPEAFGDEEMPEVSDKEEILHYVKNPDVVTEIQSETGES